MATASQAGGHWRSKGWRATGGNKESRSQGLVKPSDNTRRGAHVQGIQAQGPMSLPSLEPQRKDKQPMRHWSDRSDTHWRAHWPWRMFRRPQAHINSGYLISSSRISAGRLGLRESSKDIRVASLGTLPKDWRGTFSRLSVDPRFYESLFYKCRHWGAREMRVFLRLKSLLASPVREHRICRSSSR